MTPDTPDNLEELEQTENVYADLVTIYPDNPSYLRKYAETLIEIGKVSTATAVLKKLHDLLEKKSPEEASALAREFPQIGRISTAHAEISGENDLGEMLHKDLGALWIRLHQKKIKEGRRLYSIGEQGDTLALVLDGEMAVCIPDAKQGTILLNLIGNNDIVGEGCFLNPGLRSADIVANKDTTIVEVPRNKLVRFLTEYPGAEALLEKKSDFRQMTGLLSANKLLQGIPLNMRKYMAGAATTKRYASKTIIRRAGQETDVVDMLIWGKASYMLQDKEGNHRKLGAFRKGELIGDTSSFRKASCPADIVAETDVLMAHIPLSSFTNVVEAYPPFKEKLLHHAAKQRTAIMNMVSRLGISKDR